MTDDDLDKQLQRKYDDRGQAAAPERLTRRVLAIPASKPRRRGWLSRLTNGGFRTMFSATRIIAVGATLALLGGVLFISLPEGGDGTPVPGAQEVDSALLAPGAVLGTVESRLDESDGEAATTELGGGIFQIDGSMSRTHWEASDPRLRGEGMFVENGWQHVGTFTGLYSFSMTISNEAGSWVGTGANFSSPNGARAFATLAGTGSYDGLTAYLAIGEEVEVAEDTPETEEVSRRSFEGVIFPAAVPSFPEPLLIE